MSTGALSPVLPIAPGGPQAEAMALAMGDVRGEGGAQAMPEGAPGGAVSHAGLAALDGVGGVAMGARLDAELATPNAWAQGHAEAAPWGNPADELVAGGQHRSLAEMARDTARSLTSASPSGLDRDASGSDRLSAQATLADAASLGAAVAARPGADGGLPTSLVPNILTALHTGPAHWRWRECDDEARQSRRPRRPPEDAHDERDGDDPAGADPLPFPESPPERRAPRVAPADDPAWCQALVDALRREAHSAPAQAALQAAATAWLRGRAVLLACPAAGADASAGCLFVLRRRSAGEPGAALVGERFSARLRWSGPPADGRWWVVRVAKRHAWPRGGQLITLDDAHAANPATAATAAGRVACEIQLGPIPAAFARWSEVLVRVDAAQRLWAALGVQWSLPLLVCNQALLADAQAERACA